MKTFVGKVFRPRAGRHERPAESTPAYRKVVATGHWDLDGNFLGTWVDERCPGGRDCTEWHHDDPPRGGPFPGVLTCWCGVWDYMDAGPEAFAGHIHDDLPDPVTRTEALPF